MTKDEITAWLRNHSDSIADMESNEHDSSGNYYTAVIYRVGDKLYRVEFMNGHPVEKYISGKGYRTGEYKDPVEVFKKQRMEYYYAEVE